MRKFRGTEIQRHADAKIQRYRILVQKYQVASWTYIFFEVFFSAAQAWYRYMYNT